jgi:Fascin domain
MIENISVNVHFAMQRVDFPTELIVSVAVPDLGNVRDLSIVIERQPQHASEMNNPSKVRKIKCEFPGSGGRISLSMLIQSQTKIPLDSFWLPGRYTVKLVGKLKDKQYNDLLTHFIILKETSRIALTAYSGYYLYAEGSGGQEFFAKGSRIGVDETTFTLTNLGNNQVALQALNGQYVGIEGDDKPGVVAKATSRSDSEIFTLIDLENNRVALQAHNGQYVGIKGEEVVATAIVMGNTETFTLIDLENNLSAALDDFSELVRENAENIAKYRDRIIAHSLPGSPSVVGTDLVTVERPALAFGTLSEDDYDYWNKLSPCEQKIAYVILDIVMLVFSVLGLQAAKERYLQRVGAVARGVPNLNGLSGVVKDIKEAKTGLARAKACFKLFKQAVKVTMLKDILKEVLHDMSWWDWTKTSAIAIMQITIWLGSEGVAFIAELALVVMAFESLAEDSYEAAVTCFPNDNP